MHTTRHTYATFALASGKSLRWVADQLGHSSPMVTLRTYAHALKEEEADLGFVNFTVPSLSETSPGRHQEKKGQDSESQPIEFVG